MRGEQLANNPVELIAPSLLAVAIACWVAGFDVIYACQDAEYDRSARLHSIPAKLGVPGALRLAAILHSAMWIVLASIPTLQPELKLGGVYYLHLYLLPASCATAQDCQP